MRVVDDNNQHLYYCDYFVPWKYHNARSFGIHFVHHNGTKIVPTKKLAKNYNVKLIEIDLSNDFQKLSKYPIE